MNLNPSTQTDLFEHKEIFNQLSGLYKKDYLPKESKPVELDEEGKLKKRAIDYEVKMNKKFR